VVIVSLTSDQHADEDRTLRGCEACSQHTGLLASSGCANQMQSVQVGFEEHARQRVSFLDHLHDVQARLASRVPRVRCSQLPLQVQQIGQSEHELVHRLLREQSGLPGAE
jgi:hypothetical protein